MNESPANGGDGERDYSIRAVVSKFRDPNLEREYLAFRYPLDLRQGLYGFIGVAALLVLSCVRDYVAFSADDHAIVLKLNAYRLMGAAAAIAGIFVVRSNGPRKRFYAATFLAGSTWTIVYAALATNYHVAHGSSQSLFVFPLLALFSMLFGGYTIRYMVTSVSMVFAVSVVTHSVFMQLPASDVVQNAVLVLLVVWAGAPFSLVLQRARRSDFASTEQMNRSVELLKIENRLREIAEGELTAHRDNLEELVEKRTLELEESQAQLLRSQKMEMIGQLAGGVAHDFNNLLQVIMGYGEMALGRPETAPPVREDLDQMMKASDRAGELVRQLLALGRRQILELSDLDLAAEMPEMIRLIQRVIGDHIVLEVIAGSDLAIVNADRGQIEQVLMNFCVNARDAMEGGGKLTVETQNVELDEKYCERNAWARPGRFVMLSVSDTGCGIDDDTQKRLFEPFFTTKEAGRGTGLGLSTVFGITRQHDGLIDFESREGEGTTFRIYLPVIDRMSTERGGVDETDADAPGGTETILVADDDEMVRSVTTSMLCEAGYTVLTAGEGGEAIETFDERADGIDLAVLDVVMPGLGGKAIAEHILAVRPDIPILFCSGYGSDAIGTDFVPDEGVHQIVKPYHRSTLLRMVRDVLDD